MKNSKILTFLLAISLALNLAFLAALVYKRVLHKKDGTRPPLEMKNDFSLSAGQEKQVRAIIHKFKIDSLLAKEDIRDKRVEIIEELGNPICDPQKVNGWTNELNQLENRLNRDFIAALLKINDILEPSQRLNLLYRLSRNWFFFNREPEKGGSHE
ncbi:MAG: periplasmic heavy metal sensor [Chrysiogenales bacterium]